jgi:hypothetical protein
MAAQYLVTLTDDERADLLALTKRTHVDCVLLRSGDPQSLQLFDNKLIMTLRLQIGEEVLPEQAAELVLSGSG